MRRDEVVKLLAEHRQDLRQFGVKSLALFGSVVRGEDRPGSDVDMLVEFEGAATFDRYMGLRFFLQDLLGAPVDLVTRKALKPRLKPYVEREAQYVAD
jgi:predicted nucleotidyltransferase